METRGHDDFAAVCLISPHSLGKLIEWKLIAFRDQGRDFWTPHSLGKLIEWKLVRQDLDRNP